MNISKSAKTIVCFGDSNTWGANPLDGSRYPRDIRWPYVLQKELGKEYEVVSEGLCGRTFVVEDPAKTHRTGITHLRAILESHDPISLLIIMLGTNDIKNKYHLKQGDIAKHLGITIDLVRNINDSLHKLPQILVVCPPSPVTPDSGNIDKRMSRWPEIFNTLPMSFKVVARQKSCLYLNAGDYISSSRVDGYHLDASMHKN
jgi:lysophospholipase L1-like esterase